MQPPWRGRAALGGCRSSQGPNCPWGLRAAFGVADSPMPSGARAAPGLLPCRPRAAHPAALLPAQRGLRVSWLVSSQEPSEECARKSTTSPRMRITSKTRPSISSVSLLSRSVTEPRVLPGDPLTPRCAGTPLPIPQSFTQQVLPPHWQEADGSQPPQAPYTAAVTLRVT